MTVERPSGSTVLRIVLGQELRRLREAAGLTRHEAGDSIRSSESKISRMELGRVGFKERDVADLLTLYGVTDQAQRDSVLEKMREANTPGWWHRYRDVLPSWFQNYVGLEESVSLIRTYEIQFVPGLLQTPDYARAVIRQGNPDASAAEIEQRVDLRLRRQVRLSEPDAPWLWAVIDETALRRPLGGPATMRGQLEHLIALCRRPRTTIQVMPFRFGGHVAEGGAFSILRFPEPDVPDVVYLENLVGALYLDKPDEVDIYLGTMERLCLDSTTPESTPDVLADILREEYGTGTATHTIPQRGGTVRTESCRLPATPRIKGDLDAVLPTPFGTRILVGDVLGPPETAERTAAGALRAFRQLAPNEPSLPGLVERMRSALLPELGDEEFVTALLLTVHDDHAELVCCGNPPPLLLREGRVSPLDPLPAYPPLTLLDLGDQWCETTTVPLRPDDRLLLHTFGLLQARDDQGRAYPLADRVTALRAGGPAVALEDIETDLFDHTGGDLSLQTALLLARFDRQAAPRKTRQRTARASD